ncbi:MAG: hypothetical protein R3267_07515 [Paenisporosarcina sp.]|nr:hypothetical protein [Paenisporosarcina sp.]
MADNLDHSRNNAKIRGRDVGYHRYGWGCDTIPQSIEDIKRDIESCEECQHMKWMKELCSWHEDLFLREGEDSWGDPKPSSKVLFARAQDVLS